MADQKPTLGAGMTFSTLGGQRNGVVGSLIGEGGQGAVYSVRLGGAELALKWYHPEMIAIDGGLRERLTRAARSGPPSASFLWPIDLVEVPGIASFGYLMPLRTSGYRCARDIIARPPARLDLTLTQRLRVCVELGNCFLELHAKGYCYQDINLGNIFVDPVGGFVLVCDNDNVDVDGIPASVYGTRKFMAPEIVRREAMPSTRTDLFSLAVLMFYVLHSWHPLDGKREHDISVMDSTAESQIYGTEPLFLFDPDNRANGPVPGFHDPIELRWKTLGVDLQRLFLRSFTTGLRAPQSRVLETEWITALNKSLDQLAACGHCGESQTLDLRAPRNQFSCVVCHKPNPLPAFLALGREVLTLTPGRLVYHRHVDALLENPYGRVAIVDQHHTDETVLGLRNLGGAEWLAETPDGRSMPVRPGKTVRLVNGLKIRLTPQRVATVTVPARRTQSDTVLLPGRPVPSNTGGAL